MHSTLFLSLALVILVCLFGLVANKVKISLPIFLVIGGLLLSLIPGIPKINIDPDLVFLIILPPILYEAAWLTSWKDLWKWRRIISVLAFGFVLITSCAVALVSTAIIPGFTLALGFLLGAIISPPDAIAATSVLKDINISKRVTSILEGESLINDAASLVIFRFALAAVTTGSFVWTQAAGSFFLVIFSGIAIGIAIALVFYAIYRWFPVTTPIAITLSFVAPYMMYLVAEEVHSSGVMAVVSGGLFLSAQSHRFFSHEVRRQGLPMWSTIVFILNGLVFILIGLEFPVVWRGIKNYEMSEALFIAGVITAVVIIVRLISSQGSALFTHIIGRYITVADRNPGWKLPVVIGWAGMRGVVSLASALSIPLLLTNGEPFPHRELILFITFIVILVTLVIQGVTLPVVIRLLKLDPIEGEKSSQDQKLEIRLHLLHTTLKNLEEKYPNETAQNEMLKNKVGQLQNEIQLMSQVKEGEHHVRKITDAHQYKTVVADLIHLQRETLQRLRAKEDYDDEVTRDIEAMIDLDEERVSRIRANKEKS